MLPLTALGFPRYLMRVTTIISRLRSLLPALLIMREVSDVTLNFFLAPLFLEAADDEIREKTIPRIGLLRLTRESKRTMNLSSLLIR
tara:strand:+ start:359 stop:619 length:261 start_codon:yes stop_codon:yes gene_type:complete